MNKDLVSVIIPTYNRANTILRSINSVLNQTYRNIEVIIVDDSSTDNTKEVIDSIKDIRVKYYKLDRNHGACYARNFGIKMSSGSLVAFQDSDDEWFVNKLEYQINNMKKSNSDIDFCKFIRITPSKRIILPKLSKIISFKLYGISKSLSYGNFIGTPLLLIKRDCFDNIMFNDSLPRFQDWDLVLRLSNNYKISFTNQILCNTYIQSDSITTNNEKIVKAVDIMINNDYKYHKQLLSTLYNNLAMVENNKKEKRNYYKKSLKNNFRFKTLIKFIFNI